LRYIVRVLYVNKITFKVYLQNYLSLRQHAFQKIEIPLSSPSSLKAINKVLNVFLKLQLLFFKNFVEIFILIRNDGTLIIDSKLLTKLEDKERKAFYGDSIVQIEDKYWYEARPRFSSIHFSSQDYIGDVVFANFEIESFDSVRESAINGSLKLDKVDYSISKRNSKRVNQFNVPLLFDVGTELLAPPNQINHNPWVSVIIPTDFSSTKDYGIEKSILSLLKISARLNVEIVLITHKKKRVERNQLLDKLSNEIIFKCIEYDEEFNFSKAVNLGVDSAKCEIIFLMNDDVILDDKSDLIHLVSHLEYENNLGSIGIRLFDEFGRILHAGLEYRNGEPQHFLNGSEKDFLSNAHGICRQVSGCTGAFLVFTKSIFYRVSKMNEDFPLDYNDVDLMLKIEESGLKNIICSKVFAKHAESLTRGITERQVLCKDLKRLKDIHGKLPERDPFLYTPADRINNE
jgi:hypothetical protein